MPEKASTPVRWTNAVITLVIPLEDVSVDDHWTSKQESVANVMERILDLLPEDMHAVGSGLAEDVSDDG